MDTEQMKQRLTEQLQNKLNGGEEALHQSHVFTSAHAGDARRKRKPLRMSFTKTSPPTPLPTDGDFSLIANKRGFPILLCNCLQLVRSKCMGALRVGHLCASQARMDYEGKRKS